MKLTLAEQRAIIRSLPASRIKEVKGHCKKCMMRGEGFMDIIKSIGNVLGPIVKAVGPTVLKELIGPIINKIKGNGLSLPGGALRLAGQRGAGKKRKMKK